MKRTRCFFVTDIHGKNERYEKLFSYILNNPPDIVFFGGDLLPHSLRKTDPENYVEDYLVNHFLQLKKKLGERYPQIFLILGNDDPRGDEITFIEMEGLGIWKYMHQRKLEYGGYNFYGYAYVPPTPFRYKDWERYDVSRYVDPGCISPEEGIRTIDTGEDITYATMQKDLKVLAGDDPMEKAVFLFHSPPYKTFLDRAALDGVIVEHVPMDVNVGSIAIMRFIEEKQPLLTMHGHIHESSRLTGQWRQSFNRTQAFNAAWDGPELALIDFCLEDLPHAVRILL